MTMSSITTFVKVAELGASECDLLVKLAERVKAAEEKHPDFSDGIYQGVGVIGEEYGELCQALNKNQGEERVMDEALDLLCVVWRFCRGDWRKEKC
jgi:NTP pyrophosphatase (non-canonical NTP hydrolase)